MATNTVPVTNAGSSQVEVQLPTSLSAGAASIRLSDDETAYETTGLAATLKSGSTPLVGQQVTFTAQGVTLCEATTQAGGIAECHDATEIDAGAFAAQPTSYTATFAGDGSLQGSTDTHALSTD